MIKAVLRARSAVTGRWVSLAYAAKNTATTIVQTITRRKP